MCPGTDGSEMGSPQGHPNWTGLIFNSQVKFCGQKPLPQVTGALVSTCAFPSLADNFRYTCDICGKKYKYYSCFQEHRDLHAVDGESDPSLLSPPERCPPSGTPAPTLSLPASPLTHGKIKCTRHTRGGTHPGGFCKRECPHH